MRFATASELLEAGGAPRRYPLRPEDGMRSDVGVGDVFDHVRPYSASVRIGRAYYVATSEWRLVCRILAVRHLHDPGCWTTVLTLRVERVEPIYPFSLFGEWI